MNDSGHYLSDETMSNSLVSVFERISGWREYYQFERDNDGYITSERLGDGLAMFLWRVDKEPAKIDYMYLDGHTMVRFSDNNH